MVIFSKYGLMEPMEEMAIMVVPMKYVRSTGKHTTNGKKLINWYLNCSQIQLFLVITGPVQDGLEMKGAMPVKHVGQ